MFPRLRPFFLAALLAFPAGCAEPDPASSEAPAEDAPMERGLDLDTTDPDATVFLGEKDADENTDEDSVEQEVDATDSGEDATETGEDAPDSGEDATETGEDATETGEDATETGEDATETGEDATETGEDTTGPGEDTTGPGEDTTGPGEDSGESEGGEGGSSIEDPCDPTGLWNVTVVSNANPGEGCQGPEGNQGQSESLHIFALESDGLGNASSTLIKPTPINGNGISTSMSVEIVLSTSVDIFTGETSSECVLIVHIESLVFIPASNPDQSDGSQLIAYDYEVTYEAGPLVIGTGFGTVHTEFQTLEEEIEFPCTEAIAAGGVDP